MQVLSRPDQEQPGMIGEPGVGKTANSPRGVLAMPSSNGDRTRGSEGTSACGRRISARCRGDRSTRRC